MLCKNENRNPEHCLAEGRKVTRCAQAVITKLRENCLQEFDNHWKCLENNNQVSSLMVLGRYLCFSCTAASGGTFRAMADQRPVSFASLRN